MVIIEKAITKIPTTTVIEIIKLLLVSYKTISHWESGYTEPSLDVLFMLKNIFNVSYEELIE